MKIISAKGTGGYWIFVQVGLNDKNLTALVDTGSTSILIDERLTENLKTKSVQNIAGLGGEFKSKSVQIKLECNGITKNIEASSFNFDYIHQICDSVKVKRYDMIIGTKQIIQFNLSKKFYDTIRNK